MSEKCVKIWVDKESTTDLLEIIDSVQTEFCDSFCRIPVEAADQEEATELCKLCPLEKLKGGITYD